MSEDTQKNLAWLNDVLPRMPFVLGCLCGEGFLDAYECVTFLSAQSKFMDYLKEASDAYTMRSLRVQGNN